jgi:outer membrane protein
MPGSAFAPLAFSGLDLAAAEQAGVLQSPDVAAAQARLRGAQSALAQARAAFGPSVLAGYTENPQAGPAGTTIAQHLSTLGLQTVVGNLLSYSPLVASAHAALRAAQSDEAVAERAEKIKTAGLYYGALKARATAAARNEALSLAQAEQAAAQKRFSAGDAPRLDVVRAAVAAARATADAENAKAADANATEALRLETGADPSALAQTAGGSLPPLPAQSGDVAGAIALAQQRRADIKSAEENVSAANAAVGAARRGLLPGLIVGAGYGRGVDSGQRVAGPTLSAQLELPLSGAGYGRMRQSQALLAEAQARFAGVRRQTMIDVGSAVRNLAASQLATAATTKAREQAQQALAATELGYRSGASSGLERTVARATYSDARLSELAAIYDEALARATVELQLGP